MSCFADCGSECLVMRVPYQVAVKMLEGLPNGADKDELRKRMEIAARRIDILPRINSWEYVKENAEMWAFVGENTFG